MNIWRSLTKWLKFNKLNLSVSKTKNIVVARKYVSEASNDDLIIDNESLQEVESMKYLHVQIDNWRTFQEHLDLFVKKMAKIFLKEFIK
jgi:hypothetical protein